MPFDMEVRGKSDEVSGNIGEGSTKSICRDFLRNVCHRGRRCKFKHPSLEELEETVDVAKHGIPYEFCHDFQNNQCQRSNCRFIHCSKEEEDNFIATRKLPLRLKYQYDFGIGDCFLGQEKPPVESSLPPVEGVGRPVCRDFLNRDCHRGKKCKFLHVEHHEMALLAAEAEKSLGINPEVGAKRARMVVDEVEIRDDNDYSNLRSSHNVTACIHPPKIHLEEENENLKKRVQELEKQVSDLAATNEVLLEQNACFRLHKRGISTYGHAHDGMTTSYTPTIAMSTPANVVMSNSPRPVPVQLNVQVASQPQVPDMSEFLSPPGQEILAGGPGQPQQRAVVAPTRLHQVPVSVPQTSDIAQVIAANIAANSGGNVEVIPGTNQVVPALPGPMPQPNPQLGQPPLNSLPPQPIASFSGQNHTQMVQQPMATFPAAINSHNQMGGQQPVSFSGNIMAAALAGGRIQTATVTLSGDHMRQPGVCSMAVHLPQPTLVYTETRSTDNMPLVSTLVPAGGHEIAIVADASRNPVSSMPAPMHVAHGQPYSSPVSQSIVQTPSRQNTEIVPVAAQLACAPMTSGIGGVKNPIAPTVSMGGMRAVVQNSHTQSPRVKGGGRGVVQSGAGVADQAIISYPMSGIPQSQMRN